MPGAVLPRSPGWDAPGWRAPGWGAPGWRAGPVCGQVHALLSTRQLLTPIVQLGLQHLAAQPFPLPARHIRVLHRQVRQGRLG